MKSCFLLLPGLLSAALMLAGSPAPAQTPPAPMSAAAPVPHTYVSNGQTLTYYEAGHGEPLVLLPGGPGFAGNYLFGLADSLAGRYRLIIVDPRGCGRSQVPVVSSQTVNLDLDVADLESLRQHLKLDQLSLLGHSYGAQWAVAYAARYPAHAGRLVLVDPTDTDNRFQRYFIANILARLTPDERARVARYNQALKVKADPDSSLALVKLMGLAYVYDRRMAAGLSSFITPATHSEAVFQAHMQSPGYATLDLAPDARRLHTPTLLIHGRQDPLGEAVPLHVQSCLAGSQLVFINRCGHFPWLEQPREFYAALRPFLAQSAVAASVRR